MLQSGEKNRVYRQYLIGLGLVLFAFVAFVPFSIKPIIAIVFLSGIGYYIVGVFNDGLGLFEHITIGILVGLTLPVYPMYILNNYLGVSISFYSLIASLISMIILVHILAYIIRRGSISV